MKRRVKDGWLDNDDPSPSDMETAYREGYHAGRHDEAKDILFALKMFIDIQYESRIKKGK